MSTIPAGLKPGLFAPKAVKMVYQQLLQTIKANEKEVINANNSDFLHDFRVAVRKTRAGLNQLKEVAISDETVCYSEFFAWLGQITSPCRDLDVYLLSFEDYKACLPLSMQQDLIPLQTFLSDQQAIAQQQLTTHLTSKKYQQGLKTWEKYLQKSPKPNALLKENLTIKQLSDLRIWKVYRRVIAQGQMIDDNSEDTALHDLRKTCKKLRYLSEFFQTLYAPEAMKALLKSLKELQQVLGDFQDCAVQEQALTAFSAQMLENGGSERTFLAIEHLLQVLTTKRCKARHDFAAQFALFANAENRALFKSVFAAAD